MKYADSKTGEQYDLFGAFIDGMLSACTGETCLIDGCENAHYLRTATSYNATWWPCASWALCTRATSGKA